MYAKLKGSGESQAAYAEKLEDDDAVMKAVSCAHMAESFKFDLMGAVVALIVALAGGLALVVLFTLANTNVSEREREMATLKVLGFFDKEVHHYVNREMMVLTMMGVVLGLPLGRFVGGLLTAALNMPALYFEVECTPLSYVIAAGATMAFALLVQLFVNPVLDRIDRLVRSNPSNRRMSECPILQNRTTRRVKVRYGCPFLQNRTSNAAKVPVVVRFSRIGHLECRKGSDSRFSSSDNGSCVAVAW